MTRAKDISKIVTDADLSGTLDVTGTVTAGGLTVSGTAAINNIIDMTGSTANYIKAATSGGDLRFITNESGTNKQRVIISNNGDISFYEDTGTTPKLFWDASAERLGIGTSSPIAPLHVKGTTNGNLYVRAASLADNTLTGTALSSVNDAASATVPLALEGSEFNFVQSNAVKVKVDTSGNVGIGTSSPAGYRLHVADGTPTIRISGTAETAGLSQYLTFGTPTYNRASIQSTNVGTQGADLKFSTAPSGGNATERMRITSAGNVGIGTSGPVGILDARANATSRVHINSTGDFIVASENGADLLQILDCGAASAANANPHLEFLYASSFGGSETRLGYIGYGSTSNTDFFVLNQESGHMRFYTNNNERGRFGSGGSFFVNTASTSPNPGVVLQEGGNVGIGNSNGNSGNSFIEFRRNGTQIGGVTQSGTTGVSYNTSSDHRLKENVTADWDATTRLKQLNPVRFNFIADADTTVDGFLAHEVQSVVPEAITGTHNEVDADGNPVYQGIDQSKLVPLLVKTIQELEARIVALETA